MKISINTTFAFVKFNLNYGSVLQNYALQRYLTERGHQVSVVRDYRVNPVVIARRMKNIRYYKAFCDKLKAQCQEQRFIREQMHVSEYGYVSYHGLMRNCPEADCHIAGSDQIWRNSNASRYLSYVPEDKLKLSYAASFGQHSLSEDMKQCIAPLLCRFDGLSVREISGIEILEDMGLHGQVLLDPTLLFDGERYPYTLPAEVRGSYCYCYFLNLGSRKDIPFNSIKEYIADKGKNLRLTVPSNYPMFLDEALIFPSVEEWLGLYQAADCVFTNTYHGLLFCIIFKKQFLVCLQGAGEHPENERFYSIMELLHLSDRLITAEDSVESLQQKMEAAIDYDKIYRVIAEKRQEASDFFTQYGI